MKLSVASYLLMLRELASIATRACSPDVSSVISALNTVRIRLQRRPNIVPSNCPTMSNTGLMIMPGFPPAIPANSINMKITRRICSINPSGELACASMMLLLSAAIAWEDIAECRARLFGAVHVLGDEVVQIAFSVANESPDLNAGQ